MDILNEAETILHAARYITSRASDDDAVMYFEDETLYGFIRVCDTVEEILDNWEKEQDSFLHQNASNLAPSPKTWNAYSIFLTASAASTDAIKAELRRIEEDFRATRKIVGWNLQGAADVNHCLLPLLPIKNVVTLVGEDLQERLKTRLDNLTADQAAALFGDMSAQSFINLLLHPL